MKVDWRKLFILILFLCVCSVGMAQKADREPVGFIDDLRGVVRFRSGLPSSAEEKLDENEDKRKSLHPRDQLWRDQNAFLRICIYNKCQEVPAGVWFPIPLVGRGAAYGILSGRKKGGDSPVFSPANSTRVVLETIVIKWTPAPNMQTFSLEVQDPARNRLWEQKISNREEGLLKPTDLRDALEQFRTKGDGPFALIVRDAEDVISRSVFYLLAADEEKQLMSELATIDQQKELFLRHLNRINVFEKYEMFNEVADEYLAWLAETPESSDLLVRTIVAVRRVGDSARESELIRRLPKGVKVP